MYDFPETDGHEELQDDVGRLRYEYDQEIWRSLLSTESGRAVAFSLLQATNVFGGSFSDTDSRTNYLEGKRAIGSIVLDYVISIDPAAFTRMLNEHRGRENQFLVRARREA